ncbi:ubiquinol-cytochrome C chaperone family protein [Ferrovibrio xuzhouensis]|uniref:Ubiquinol-cytochrome C chaperone family protein n=1 Tax=Ferrovibrio xuzhouensis TaxID=1576914 RepID=A0ABV7VIQ7_9PROT
MLTNVMSFFSPKPEKAVAVALYRVIVAQARLPRLYSEHGVPDTLDGRFDMIILHAYLASRRLKAMNTEESQTLNQALFDLIFADMDSSLREIGIGDLSVGKKVKVMAQAFYGRVEAYDAGLAADTDAVLAEALQRNLFGTVNPQPAQSLAVAAYVRRVDATLAVLPDREILAGNLEFPAP